MSSCLVDVPVEKCPLPILRSFRKIARFAAILSAILDLSVSRNSSSERPFHPRKKRHQDCANRARNSREPARYVDPPFAGGASVMTSVTKKTRWLFIPRKLRDGH